MSSSKPSRHVYEANANMQGLLVEYGTLRQQYPNVNHDEWQAVLYELAEYAYAMRERIFITDHWSEKPKGAVTEPAQ